MDGTSNKSCLSLRSRVRCGIGFALGLAVLVLVDLFYYRIPRLFGRKQPPAA